MAGRGGTSGRIRIPGMQGKHPELKDKAIVPDVLLQPHNASLEFTFYEADKFPAEYKGDIFASEHGSWNKATRVGYEVIRVPLHQTGHATGEYQDFLTGFVLPDGHVWGRPVGITRGAGWIAAGERRWLEFDLEGELHGQVNRLMRTPVLKTG